MEVWRSKTLYSFHGKLDPILSVSVVESAVGRTADLFSLGLSTLHCLMSHTCLPWQCLNDCECVGLETGSGDERLSLLAILMSLLARGRRLLSKVIRTGILSLQLSPIMRPVHGFENHLCYSKAAILRIAIV